MRIYCKNYFDKTSYIEAPCPIPSRSNLVVDVKYAFDVYSFFNAIPPSKKYSIGKFYNKLTASSIKKFLLLSARSSFNHAKKRTMRKLQRDLQARHLTFVSVSGLVHSVSDNITAFQPGDHVAALGFLQPALADYVLVPEQLAVKLPNPSDRILLQSSLLFIGTMASCILDKCLNLRAQYPAVNHLFFFRNTLYTDLLISMFHHFNFIIHECKYDDDAESQTITPNCLFSIFAMAGSHQISSHHDVLRYSDKNTLTYFCLGLNNIPHNHKSVKNSFLYFPDPWIQHNLNMYSHSPLDLPEWCERHFLKRYISFIENKPINVDDTSYIRKLYISPKNPSPTICLRSTPRNSSKLNVAVIGTGLFANNFLRSFITLGNVHLRAIADRNIYNAFIAAKTYGADIMSSDVEAIFNDNAIDVVFIVTHHNSHAPLAIRALESGKFVYLEKPQVVSFDQLDKLVQAASKSPGKLHIGFNRRYAKVIEITKALLRDKKSPVNISFTKRFHETTPNSFYHWEEQGTRVISNLCHHLDLAHYLVGAHPVSISGMSSTIGRNDENIIISVAYEDGSLCTVLAGNHGDPTIRGEENIRITCEKLTIDITDYSKVYGREDGKIVAQWKGMKDVGREKGLHTFFKSVTQRGVVPYPNEDIYLTGLTFLKAEKALISGNMETIG